ncbi:hypothetical protein BKA70DRAFT_1232569 [Coprinopsis sp. MPI-PUGE-AT-0042]|nr:hypothetical protein BKA70DRAFT_1232569 [Coprinopsis sp. MPI-PUGE-AT-0042]
MLHRRKRNERPYARLNLYVPLFLLSLASEATREEQSIDYISSWDLSKDTLLYVRVVEPFSYDASTSTSSSCVVEYGREKVRKVKAPEKQDSSKTTAPSSSILGEQASEPEPPPLPPRRHPLSDEDYVDSFLLPHELLWPDQVAQAGPSSSTSHKAPAPSSHSHLDTPRPTPDAPPLIFLAGSEPGMIEPELLDPAFRLVYLQRGGALFHGESLAAAREGTKGVSSREGRKAGRRRKSRSRERVGERKENRRESKKGKNAEPAPTYERIPFPPGTKGFFDFVVIFLSGLLCLYFLQRTTTNPNTIPGIRRPPLPRPSSSTRRVMISRVRMEPSQGLGRFRFECFANDALWMEEKASASPPTPAALATRSDASQSLSTPSKPPQSHPALLTPSEASQIDTLLPPYMPRIGPHTMVLQSVLDPFVMDLSVNDMSVVVIDALRKGSALSPSSPPSPSSSTSSPTLSPPSNHHEQQPHKIHYTKFKNMLVPLSWSHHRGPYTYNTPAHIPISKRFMTDRPALKTLLWKRRRKSPWTGQALVRFELTPPPTSKSIHAHPLLGLRILKFVVPPDPQPVWKRPKPQVVGRLVSRWKPQSRLHLSPWHPQRVRYPFPEEVMRVLKEQYCKPEWVEGRTRRRGVSYRERKAREVRAGKGKKY